MRAGVCHPNAGHNRDRAGYPGVAPEVRCVMAVAHAAVPLLQVVLTNRPAGRSVAPRVRE